MQLSDRAYVISLYLHTHQKAVDRLKGVGFTDIVPYVANRPTKEEWAKYVVNRKTPNWAGGRLLRTPGALGCLLSHKGVLEEIADTRRPGFIFEDDVLFHKNFFNLFNNAAMATAGCPWIYLGTSQLKWKRIPRKTPSYRARLSLGTFAYWVDSYMAEFLLKGVSKYNTPVDQYYARYLQLRHLARVCYPYLCIADVSRSDTGQGPRSLEKVAKIYGWDIDEFDR